VIRCYLDYNNELTELSGVADKLDGLKGKRLRQRND
jgi:hypothetical protein